MRILAITNLYPRPGHELLAPFNRQQFRALAQHHAVRVIAPVPWHQALKDKFQHRSAPGHYVNADGIEVDHPTYYHPPRVMHAQMGQFYYGSIRPCVRRALAKFQPDVLLSCWTHPDGWAAARLARELGLPVVLKAIGSDLLVITREARRRARVAEALRQSAAVVTVCQDLAGQAVRLGAERGSVHVVPEGLDRELFMPGDREAARARLGLPRRGRMALFVGNLLFSKGVGVLVEACRGLRDGGFSCYLIGGGRDEGKLRSLIARYGLGDCVKLVGPCAHEKLPDWYRACDVVALPSFSEGIPNVLREAISCGRPFVATEVGGIPEIAHPSYSRLVSPGDAAALAEALVAMLAEPPTVDEQLVRRLNPSWQESAEQLAEVLADAVEGSGFRVQGSGFSRGPRPEFAGQGLCER